MVTGSHCRKPPIRAASPIRKRSSPSTGLTPEEFACIDRLSAQVKAYSKQVSYDYDTSLDVEPDAPVIDPETGELVEPLK